MWVQPRVSDDMALPMCDPDFLKPDDEPYCDHRNRYDGVFNFNDTVYRTWVEGGIFADNINDSVTDSLRDQYRNNTLQTSLNQQFYEAVAQELFLKPVFRECAEECSSLRCRVACAGAARETYYGTNEAVMELGLFFAMANKQRVQFTHTCDLDEQFVHESGSLSSNERDRFCIHATMIPISTEHLAPVIRINNDR